MYDDVVAFIRETFGTDGKIPLHEPRFRGNEKAYVDDAIDSTFVSSVGEYVTRFERAVADYVGCGHAVATVNGTAALHAALVVAGVRDGDEVITQPLTFIATANAIAYCRAKPVFVDVDLATCGLSAQALRAFLERNAEVNNGACVNRKTGQVIRACVPMHAFGHPCRIEEIAAICAEWNIALVEDAAEALGSRSAGRHVGHAGPLGVLSFNGNKIITTGGGGMIVTDDPGLARHAKHITTTAKRDHQWEFAHDEIGFNYRMPNLNAALGCAQMEMLPSFLTAKRRLAACYQHFFEGRAERFLSEPANTELNYWLNCIAAPDRVARDTFLKATNEAGVMTRPAWTPIPSLPMYAECECGPTPNAERLADTLISLPSSVISGSDV